MGFSQPKRHRPRCQTLINNIIREGVVTKHNQLFKVEVEDDSKTAVLTFSELFKD